MRDVLNRYLVTQVRSVTKSSGRLLRSPLGIWILGLISFIESALPVPILTDPFLVAYILANQTRVVLGVVVTTVTSVMGGVVAVLTAQYFFTLILSFLAPDTVTELNSLTVEATDSTFILSLFGAFTPIPYTLSAWAVGIIEGSLFLFILASVIGRGARYAIVGYAAHQFGAYALARSRWYLIGASVALVVITIGYVLSKM
jgi:membrane protein YqaA with SNARE-associated domain